MPLYLEAIKEISKKHEVKSFIPDQANFIFILESPHTAELKHNIPVAGRSGTTMSRHLLGEDFKQPLGILLKENAQAGFINEKLNKIGLLNVSQIPMQRKAYTDEETIKHHDSFISKLETIRTSNQTTTYSSHDLNEVQAALVFNFKNRLNELSNRECTLIPCGRFSQKFFGLANLMSSHWSVIEEVPHPSYNSWSREKYSSQIKQLIKTFHCSQF